jgi:hypothetical protein
VATAHVQLACDSSRFGNVTSGTLELKGLLREAVIEARLGIRRNGQVDDYYRVSSTAHAITFRGVLDPDPLTSMPYLDDFLETSPPLRVYCLPIFGASSEQMSGEKRR